MDRHLFKYKWEHTAYAGSSQYEMVRVWKHVAYAGSSQYEMVRVWKHVAYTGSSQYEMVRVWKHVAYAGSSQSKWSAYGNTSHTRHLLNLKWSAYGNTSHTWHLFNLKWYCVWIHVAYAISFSNCRTCLTSYTAPFLVRYSLVQAHATSSSHTVCMSFIYIARVHSDSTRYTQSYSNPWHCIHLGLIRLNDGSLSGPIGWHCPSCFQSLHRSSHQNDIPRLDSENITRFRSQSPPFRLTCHPRFDYPIRPLFRHHSRKHMCRETIGWSVDDGISEIGDQIGLERKGRWGGKKEP
jgi:hypothetical protein